MWRWNALSGTLLHCEELSNTLVDEAPYIKEIDERMLSRKNLRFKELQTLSETYLPYVRTNKNRGNPLFADYFVMYRSMSCSVVFDLRSPSQPEDSACSQNQSE